MTDALTKLPDGWKPAELTPVRDYVGFMLRLPPEMRDRIAAAAKANGRSMNSEIVKTLEAQHGNSDDAKIWQLANAIAPAIREVIVQHFVEAVVKTEDGR